MEQQLIPYAATKRFRDGRMLVLAPHPDDEVFGCGGAILRHIANGQAVRVDILTDGAYQRTPEYAAIRRQESREAAAVLGYGEPTFWGLGDRELEYGEALVQRIVDAIATFGATQVFAPSIYEMHPDHRGLGIAAIEATRRTPTVAELVMYEVGVPMLRPNILLDISDLQESKCQAMSCFASQLEQQAYDVQINALNCFRSYTLGPSVKAAEAYRTIPQAQLCDLPLEVFESEYQRQSAMGFPMIPDDLPLVSVVILQSDSPGLVRALDAIATQTYPHVEVLLPYKDGHEPLPTGGQCGRFPLRQVTQAGALTHQELVNLGMDRAKGTYVMILDAQDVVLPDHLQGLVRAIARGQTRVAYSGVRWVDRDGRVQRTENSPALAESLRNSNVLPNCAFLFERALISDGCHFPQGLPNPSSWAFWLQVAERTSFVHVPTVSALVCPPEFSRQSAPCQDNLQTAALEAELAEARSDRNQLTGRVAELQAQLTHWQDMNEVQTRQVQNLQSTVLAYASSTSWKISAPIRWASRLLHRNTR